jgi:hypothetical protein
MGAEVGCDAGVGKHGRFRAAMDEVFLVLFVHKKNALPWRI